MTRRTPHPPVRRPGGQVRSACGGRSRVGRIEDQGFALVALKDLRTPRAGGRRRTLHGGEHRGSLLGQNSSTSNVTSGPLRPAAPSEAERRSARLASDDRGHRSRPASAPGTIRGDLATGSVGERGAQVGLSRGAAHGRCALFLSCHWLVARVQGVVVSRLSGMLEPSLGRRPRDGQHLGDATDAVVRRTRAGWPVRVRPGCRRTEEIGARRSRCRGPNRCRSRPDDMLSSSRPMQHGVIARRLRRHRTDDCFCAPAGAHLRPVRPARAS